MSHEEQSFDVFITYRRSDGSRAAQRLRRWLQSYDISKRLKHRASQRLTVFLDTVYERGAVDFYEKNIFPALAGSRFLVVLATPDAVLKRGDAEDWIAREIKDFRTHCDPERILVVRAAGDLLDELPGDLSITAPNIQVIDLRLTGYWSPFQASRAVDEWLKLVAPLFDVSSEEMPKLRREQERARQSRISIISGALAGVMALTIALAAVAIKANLKSEAAISKSLFAIGQIMQSTNDFGIGEEIEEQRSALLMMECDLFDALAGDGIPKGYELERAICDTDRADALYRQGERERAQELIEKVRNSIELRYENTKSPEVARAFKKILDYEWALARAEEEKEGGPDAFPALAANFNEFIEMLLAAPRETDFFQGLEDRLWQLTGRAEDAGQFEASRALMQTSLEVYEQMTGAQERHPSVNMEAKQQVLLSRVVLQRRLGWLDQTHLGNPARSETEAKAAIALLDEMDKQKTEIADSNYSLDLLWQRVLAEETLGLAKELQRNHDAARAALGRALQTLQIMQTQKLNEEFREKSNREAQFILAKLSKLEGP